MSPTEAGNAPNYVTTNWKCEACGASGTLSAAPNTGVWSVIQALLDAHRNASPDCTEGQNKIRVGLA